MEAFRGPSRSRYPALPETLRDVVGSNAYLVCRITDCIEDEPALTPREKQRFANPFVDVVEGREDATAIGPELAAALSSSTPRGERDLVANTARVVRIARGFRQEQRRAVARCVRIMASGMSDFQQLDTSAGLKDLRQLNRYCYVVAGVVGEMLTELFCDYSNEIEKRRDELLPLAVSFGQGLQMTNILKDRLGRSRSWSLLVAARRDNPAFGRGVVELVGIARGHLVDALRFVQLIPVKEAGIRRHWCLGHWDGGADAATHSRDADVRQRTRRQDLPSARSRCHDARELCGEKQLGARPSVQHARAQSAGLAEKPLVERAWEGNARRREGLRGERNVGGPDDRSRERSDALDSDEETTIQSLPSRRRRGARAERDGALGPAVQPQARHDPAGELHLGPLAEGDGCCLWQEGTNAASGCRSVGRPVTTCRWTSTPG